MIASQVYVETVSEVYVGTASEVYVGAVALGCPPGEARLPDSFTKPYHRTDSGIFNNPSPQWVNGHCY
jgi:hypothetical protein